MAGTGPSPLKHKLREGEVNYVEPAKRLKKRGFKSETEAHFVPYDREKRVGAGIWDDHDMNLATALKETENRDLAGSATASLALSASAEIALVGLDFAAHEARLRRG
jgi:hypothetical protein